MNLARSCEKRVLKLKSWLFDRQSLDLTEETLGDLTRRNLELPLKEDRLRELMDYYELSRDEALATQSEESMAVYKRAFDSGVETDKVLFDNYRACRMLSNARHMLGYTRFGPASRLLKYINSHYLPGKRRNIRMLDYGCGVSDYGLAFASQGYRVTLADIAGGNLEFAKWRYQVREVPADVIPITEDNPYPDLGRQHIIIAGEVLEHVRDPVRLLENIHAALPVGGLFWNSGYPDHERTVGGCHLEEAGAAREEALGFLRRHFRPASRLSLPGFLYRKV